MKTNKIYAKTDTIKLLRNGNIAQIGTYDELGKQYKPNGVCVGIKCISFDFAEDGNVDRFFFEDDKLVYHFISLARKSWLNDLLMDALKMEFLTYDTLITTVLEGYILHKMYLTAGGQ
jgi:hypothetical protein